MENWELGAHKRKTEFEDALLALMVQKPYSEITIVDLIQRVGVSRKTFYLHFRHKDACLESLTDRLLFEQTSHIAAVHQSQDMVSFHRAGCEYWLCQKNYLRSIRKNDLFLHLLQRALYYIRTEEQQIAQLLCMPYQQNDDDILTFYVTGYIAVLINWAGRDFDTPTDVLAKKLERLLQFSLFPECEGQSVFDRTRSAML